jgi:hypothetical protein
VDCSVLLVLTLNRPTPALLIIIELSIKASHPLATSTCPLPTCTLLLPPSNHPHCLPIALLLPLLLSPFNPPLPRPLPLLPLIVALALEVARPHPPSVSCPCSPLLIVLPCRCWCRFTAPCLACWS